MAGRWDTYRLRAEAFGEDAKQRWAAEREAHSSIGMFEAMFLRDKLAFGSVLGSALALRLFLFIIPANVTLIAFTRVLHFTNWFNEAFTESITTGPMAASLLQLSRTQALGIFLSSAVLTVWAGRSMARVLAASSGVSWGLTLTETKQRMKAMAALIGVIFASIMASLIINMVREAGGIAVGAVLFFAVAGIFSVAWFLVMLTLPRNTTDPGALIPGALLFGVCYSGLQWFMQYYLPARVARTSDTLGQMATTVAILGNFFFIGRLMSASFVFTAVLYEHHGSLSHVLFNLPGVRRLPKKFPWLREYFALDVQPGEAHAPIADVIDLSDPAQVAERMEAAMDATLAAPVTDEQRSDGAGRADGAS